MSIEDKTNFLGLLWNAKVQIEFDNMDEAVPFAAQHGGWIGSNQDETKVIWFSREHTIGEAMRAMPRGYFRIGPFSDFRQFERIIPSVIWH
jgi:hypothetical protein